MPLPDLAGIVIAAVAHVALMRSSYGVDPARRRAAIRGPIERAGWSVLKAKVTMYALAGFFGVLSGLSLIGLTTSADANIADRYTLLSIAGVILGGGEFVGGRVSPIGAVIGALTLTLAGSFLIFMRIPPDWQIGAQGAILIIVLALARAHQPAERRAMTMLAPHLPQKPWIWSFVAAFAVWLATIIFTGGQGGERLLTAALTFAAFFVIVGMGQMFVITLGPGNVDLSIPATITLAGSVAMKVMDTDNALILVGILAALACGRRGRHLQLRPDPAPAHPADHRDAVVELPRPVDGDLLWPRHPHQAAAASRRFRYRASRGRAAPRHAGDGAGGPMAIILKRTTYGRSVLAIGQNPRAARLRRPHVDLARFSPMC